MEDDRGWVSSILDHNSEVMALNTEWYLHIDMDAFFASVEQVLDPSLKDKPIIVGGRRGRGEIGRASCRERV